MKQKENKLKKRWIAREYSLSWKFILSCKNFIFLTFGIFIISAFLGYFFPNFFEKQILEFLKSLISDTENLSWIQMIIYLFQNNLMSAFLGMILGVFLGIFPLITSIVNGYLIGFVVNKSVTSEGFSILWRLFPHGIFELPALFLSLGIGIRLGMFLFSRKPLSNLRNDFSDALRVFIFVIFPLLLVAACIEGTLIVFFG